MAGAGTAFAVATGNLDLPSGRSRGDQINQWFNTAAVAQADAGTFGSLGRNVLRNPGTSNFDSRLSRIVPLKFREGGERAVSVRSVQRPESSAVGRAGQPAGTLYVRHDQLIWRAASSATRVEARFLTWRFLLVADFLLSVPASIALRAQPSLYDVRRLGGLEQAIDAAAKAGGGTVYVPAGQYVCGTIHLRSHVSIWLDNGATLTMSPDPAAFDKPERLDYDPHADAATSFFRNGLLVGEQLEDVAIFGQGAIDGNRTRSGGPKAISLKRCPGTFRSVGSQSAMPLVTTSACWDVNTSKSTASRSGTGFPTVSTRTARSSCASRTVLSSRLTTRFA